MKESWMEKLIELLNEYLDDGQERLYACYPLDEDFDKFFHTKDWEWTIEEAQVISKKFWFIERLVENDKIDFSWEWELAIKLVNLFERKVDNADWVIALLSISDNPIEDLISYLKIS